MAKIYWEEQLFPQFLSTIDSCTIQEYNNTEIQNELNHLAVRSVADFKFPKVSLNYDFDSDTNAETGVEYGYYFTEEITQKEINVLLARMKHYWVEYQISQEKTFSNTYYDKNIRVHSQANIMHNLDKMLKTFRGLADRAEYNYYRVNSENRPRWGDINE